jgi:hypothetical protein
MKLALPPRLPSCSWRLAALLLLAGWATLLSLETWFRSPGFSSERGLPRQLEREGRMWRRQASSVAPVAELPAGVALLEAADYAPDPPEGERVHLRRLGLATSGTGVDLPVEALAAALLGEGATGRCVVLDERGAVRESQATAAAWVAWIDPQRPDRGELLRWLLGLRPFRANTCLWEGRQPAERP